MKLSKDNLKQTTFWDCEIDKLELEKDKFFIIARIAERGTDIEVDLMHEYYSLKDINYAVNHSKEISELTLNYYNTIVLDDFRKQNNDL